MNSVTEQTVAEAAKGVAWPMGIDALCAFLAELEYDVTPEWVHYLMAKGIVAVSSDITERQALAIAVCAEARHRWAPESVQHDHKKSEVRCQVEALSDEDRHQVWASWNRFDNELLLAMLVSTETEAVTKQAAYEALRLRLAPDLSRSLPNGDGN